MSLPYFLSFRIPFQLQFKDLFILEPFSCFFCDQIITSYNFTLNLSSYLQEHTQYPVDYIYNSNSIFKNTNSLSDLFMSKNCYLAWPISMSSLLILQQLNFNKVLRFFLICYSLMDPCETSWRKHLFSTDSVLPNSKFWMF